MTARTMNRRAGAGSSTMRATTSRTRGGTRSGLTTPSSLISTFAPLVLMIRATGIDATPGRRLVRLRAPADALDHRLEVGEGGDMAVVDGELDHDRLRSV